MECFQTVQTRESQKKRHTAKETNVIWISAHLISYWCFETILAVQKVNPYCFPQLTSLSMSWFETCSKTVDMNWFSLWLPSSDVDATCDNSSILFLRLPHSSRATFLSRFASATAACVQMIHWCYRPSVVRDWTDHLKFWSTLWTKVQPFAPHFNQHSSSTEPTPVRIPSIHWFLKFEIESIIWVCRVLFQHYLWAKPHGCYIATRSAYVIAAKSMLPTEY